MEIRDEGRRDNHRLLHDGLPRRGTWRGLRQALDKGDAGREDAGAVRPPDPGRRPGDAADVHLCHHAQPGRHPDRPRLHNDRGRQRGLLLRRSARWNRRRRRRRGARPVADSQRRDWCRRCCWSEGEPRNPAPITSGERRYGRIDRRWRPRQPRDRTANPRL